ncbi:alpha/beta-hydrolase [Obba rivulosa]|uniref:Alpha/beta-hydrolase n=1 Tax=Obba rivulosa TaxID=1052685 RepID=A0A8E2AU73_9APHY|nr:alpha/beta-hydrolase [Obba rivulosa]
MPFAFRHQPLKAIYLTVSILYLLVCLPIWTIMGMIPGLRPRRSWTLKRTLIVKAMRTGLGIMFNTSLINPVSPDTYAASAETSGFVWVDPAPALVVGEIQDMAQINDVQAQKACGFWYGPRGPNSAVGQRASKDEKIIYHMHGGGYVMGTAHPSNKSVSVLFKGFHEHFGSDIRIFALEYRKSCAPPFGSANPFPAAFIDVVAGYRYLIEDLGFEPRNVIVSGDSAGGGLAFGLALYLATNKFPNLPNAAGVLLLSPTVDWAVTHTGRDSAMVRNDASDFVQAIFSSSYTKRALLGKLPDETAATSMWFSPGSMAIRKPPGAFAGLPPTCIVTGGAEITLDPMTTLRDRILEDNGKESVLYIEMPDATHDFFTVEWHEPERTVGLRQVGSWVRKVFGEQEALLG